MARRRMLQAFEAAKDLANYADAPVMPIDVDPQITLARITERQPFSLAFEEDTIIALMSGTARVHLRDTNVTFWSMIPGDHVYVPAGTPHRFEPDGECVYIRYVANEPKHRAAVFTCDGCQAELDRLEWQQDLEVEATAIYAELARRFNDDLERRTCASCGSVAPEISLERLGWVQPADA